MSYKQTFFTIKELDKIAAKGDYVILIGERANGKSYSVKSRVLLDAFESIEGGICKKEIAYLRRYDLDCKDSLCSAYFADMPVQEITNGKYTCVTVFRKDIYFGHVDDDGKTIRDIKIGRCFAISAAEHLKSLMFPYIYNIVFEEFVTMSGNYLYNEPLQMQHVVSSLARRRKCKIYMIGNTISRQCPYYTEWNLNAERLKPNESNVVLFDSPDFDVNSKLVIHRCRSEHFNSGLFFGRAADSIVKGEYISEPYPHLEHNVLQYRTAYMCVLEYDTFLYLMRYIYYPIDKEYVWYIEPKTTPIKAGTRVITNNKWRGGRRVTSNFSGLNEKERFIFRQLFDKTKVYFSDNLTGTEFNNLLVNYK